MLIDDVRVLVMAKRSVELALAIDAEQAVKAGLVEVDNTRGTLDLAQAQEGLRIAIEIAQLVEVLRAVLVSLERGNELVNLIADDLINPNQLVV